jgi:hypothetical protein
MSLRRAGSRWARKLCHLWLSQPVGAPGYPARQDTTVLCASSAVGRAAYRGGRTTTPRPGGGVRTLNLRLCKGDGHQWREVHVQFVNAEPRNIPCGRTIRPPTLCTAAMRPLVALSAFLDVSSLNLAVPQAPPFFARRSARKRREHPHCVTARGKRYLRRPSRQDSILRQSVAIARRSGAPCVPYL